MIASEKISSLLKERVDAGDFPSAVYLVGGPDGTIAADAIGNAVVEPEVIPATLTTIYDVASLTKVLSTTLIAAIAIESGDLDPTAPVSRYLNDLHNSASSETTINHLAMHRSGLPAWLPLYLIAEDRYSVTAAIAALIPESENVDVIYSDLNFILLADVIETIYGEAIIEVFDTLIARPLGLKDTCFTPESSNLQRIAGSEHGNHYELQMVTEKFPELPIIEQAFRSDVIWAQVHDGNAYFLGGAAGHAGLFSTVADIFEIAKQFLPRTTTLLRPETCELFCTNFTAGMCEDRSFGFQLASTQDSTAGDGISHRSFGHNGFTGTSLWIDPETERISVLLTNRTHARQLPFANINGVRREFHTHANDLSI